MDIILVRKLKGGLIMDAIDLMMEEHKYILRGLNLKRWRLS